MNALHDEMIQFASAKITSGLSDSEVVASLDRKYAGSTQLFLEIIAEAKLVAEPQVAEEPTNSVSLEAESVQEPQVAPFSKFKMLAYAAVERGESRVLPIAVGGKQPLIKWKDSPIDVMTGAEWDAYAPTWIEQMAAQFPNANVAVLAKPGAMLFIDEDDSKGFRAGYEAWSGEKFPNTYATSARENRLQSHWLQTDATRKMGNIPQGGVSADISVRQNNLYVLAEGSQYKDGARVYQSVGGEFILSMPDKLVEYIQSIRTKTEKGEKIERNERQLIPHGSVHNYMLQEAGKLRGMGLGEDEIYSALSALVHKNCEPPIDESKVKAMAKSICGFPEGAPAVPIEFNMKPDTATTAAAPTGIPATPVVKRMSDYRKKKLYWLWQHRVPFGEMTTLAGDPDEGKSLITLNIAACVSQGQKLFGNTEDFPPMEVLLLSAEDDPETTLRPRLEAAGADMDRVFLLESVVLKGGAGQTLEDRCAQLDTDIKMIEAVLEQNPNIKLIIIDPISSFLGRASINKEQEVRRVLKPLADRARKNRLAVILVAHFNKNSETKSAMDRVGGAKAIVGMGRAAWTCVREPKRETKEGEPIPVEDPDRRLFLKLKGNLTPSKVGGLVYTIRTKPVDVEGDKGVESTDVPYILWVEETQQTAQEVVIDGKVTKAESKLETAKKWLQEFLTQSSGHAHVGAILLAASKAGHGERTLRRAAELLAVEAGWVDAANERGRESHWGLAGCLPKQEPGEGEPGKPKRRKKANTVSLTGDPLQDALALLDAKNFRGLVGFTDEQAREYLVNAKTPEADVEALLAAAEIVRRDFNASTTELGV